MPLNDAAVHQAVYQFIGADDAEIVYQALVTHAKEALECDACRVVTAADSEAAFVLRASSEETPPDTDQPISLSQSIARHTFRTGTASIINDLAFTRGTAADAADQSRVMTLERSVLTAPIDNYGVFQALDQHPGAFRQADLDWAEDLITFAREALDRIQSASEPAVNAAAVRQEERERVLDIVGSLAHDLRGPLNVAEGYLDIARNAASENDFDPTPFERVSEALDRIEQLVTGMQTRVKEGQIDTTADRVNLEQVAESSWAVVPTADAQLVIDETMQFQGNTANVQRIFENLFRNAVEHGGDDVTIRVGALDDETGFYVADDGPGIPETEREQVFEQGFSNDDTDALSGFGLSIVQWIIEAHGWTITITESAAGGTRFEIVSVDII